jgi:hypothetical protein
LFDCKIHTILLPIRAFRGNSLTPASVFEISYAWCHPYDPGLL